VRAVFLDRDGVLNASVVRDGKPYPPESLADLEILDEAREGCALLREAGFALICVTNQPDIARGAADSRAVDQINARLAAELRLDQVRVCPHDDRDNCGCRKPKPGLILDAAAELGIDLDRSFLVGDRWRDIDAGRAAGCITVFIDRGYRERQPADSDFVARSTLEASRWIVSHDPAGLERT
jgi:D-glycero-D-manno-heptose 1,7-bisphosphate phosphatase